MRTSIPKPMTTTRRRVAMLEARLTPTVVAEATGCDPSYVSQLVYGHKTGGDGPKAQRVKAFIAGRLNLPVDLVFPPQAPPDRRQGERRAEERRVGPPAAATLEPPPQPEPVPV